MSSQAVMTPTPAPAIRARRAGFFADIITVAIRALRSIPRDPEAIYPALFIPVFFYAINIGALQDVAERIPGLDYKAFQLPVAVVFAVTGVSRAVTVVTDIQSGYFDRLSFTPISRMSMLLGLTIADFALVLALSIPVVAMGFIVGVRFESGALGVMLYLLLSCCWGLVYTGFPYAVAFKTGNPAAVNSTFLLFFPFVFFSPVFVPIEAMTGWLATIAIFNPVTYLLDALRSLITVGWDGAALLRGVGAIAGVGVVSGGLALAALRGRTRRR